MDAWQRAIAFMRSVDERAAESVVPFRWGRALINRRLDRVPDLNFLIADHVEEAGASDLDAEAERIQGDAGLSHRRVNVDDPPAAERLSAAFGLLGYTPERFVIMAHRRRPDREVDTAAVQEVDWELMRPAREREIASQPWGADPRVVAQLLAKQQLTAQSTRTRYFAARSTAPSSPRASFEARVTRRSSRPWRRSRNSVSAASRGRSSARRFVRRRGMSSSSW